MPANPGNRKLERQPTNAVGNVVFYSNGDQVQNQMNSDSAMVEFVHDES